jgi:integrase
MGKRKQYTTRKTVRGEVYDVRYRDSEGAQRTRTFRTVDEAKDFATTVRADVLRNTYIDPNAGKITVKRYAQQWLDMQTFNESTREATEVRLRVHVYPTLGAKQLRLVKPSTIQAWLHSLDKLAPSYRRVLYANVSSIFRAAVDDELIAKNPCRAASVRPPKVERRKLIPWTEEQVASMHEALPERHRIVAVLGAGLGLRQGEVFGLTPDDVDFLRGFVDVRRQVKLFADGTLTFALPKYGKTRRVPLPSSVRDELAAYLAQYKATKVMLPWATRDGDPVTVPLVLTTRERTALRRTYFNHHVWKPALARAGIAHARVNGTHALRHFYASVLLDRGESIKAVSEYLGHADAGFTLRTYTHLMPSSDERSRQAIDSALHFGAPRAERPKRVAERES